MTPILSKPYYRSELDLLPTNSTNPETTNWRCLMASEETASRITSYRRESFSARPASSSNATSGSLLHSSSSESTGRRLSSPAPSLRTTLSFPKPRTNPLGLPTHKQQDPPNNSFHLCTVGGVYSCHLPCSLPI